MIYFDNAATSWPKPPAVIDAMVRFLRDTGANPGRSGHQLSIQAARQVYEARERLARLFNHPDPLTVVFTKNATEALNLAIFGLVVPGDHVITSVMEHNSVLRPLRQLQERGVRVTRVGCAAGGVVDLSEIQRALATKTKLVILSHASNVVGTVYPIGEVGALAAQHGALFCVDAAQTAGCYPIDMRAMGIDLLAFTGHKALYGPQGTGGLCIGARARGLIAPLMVGGTGSASDSDRQPDFLPDRYEAGTLNAVGLSGLAAGVAFVESTGIEQIIARERSLTARLVNGLERIDGVHLYGPVHPEKQVAVISFNVDRWSCAEVASALEERAGVCCRVGLHCAPFAHRQLGTFPHGTVRFGFGMFNQPEEIDTALGILEELVARGPGEAP
jgi:cysteine desulfurase / selenocysteine lyase